MKTRRLFNTSAYKTSRILEDAVRNTGFRVYPELPLSLVLELDRSTLSRQERNTINTASFDFVVYNEGSFPEFAIEFDGPDHRTYEKTIRADIRKNRLCCGAGLPLLRINDDFLTEYEKSSLLEFVVRRFVKWRNDQDQLTEEEAEIHRFLTARGAAEEEYEEMMEPQLMWDLEHQFPASRRLGELLYTTYGVVNTHMTPEAFEVATSAAEYLMFGRDSYGSSPLGLYHRTVQRGYDLTKMTRKSSTQFETERVHDVSVAVTYQWRLQTVDLEDAHVKNFIIEYTHGQGLPGTSTEELTDHFCDFLALKQLNDWAEVNLKNVNTKQPSTSTGDVVSYDR